MLFQAFEDNMKQKQEALHKLREKLLDLIKTHPNSPEAAKWKQMLAEIGVVHGVGFKWPRVVYVYVSMLTSNVAFNKFIYQNVSLPQSLPPVHWLN